MTPLALVTAEPTVRSAVFDEEPTTRDPTFTVELAAGKLIAPVKEEPFGASVTAP